MQVANRCLLHGQCDCVEPGSQIARGEAVVLGERYGIRLIEVLVGDEMGASKP